MRAGYRAVQFVQALIARPGRDELELAERLLPPPLLELFLAMSRADQAHGLRVLAKIRETGESHPDLLAAALLHDVGKSRVRLSIIERVVVTLIGGVAAGLADGKPDGWRKPFVVAYRHPEWGAEMVRQAGGSRELQRLVRDHQSLDAGEGEMSPDRLLIALRAADNQS